MAIDDLLECHSYLPTLYPIFLSYLLHLNHSVNIVSNVYSVPKYESSVPSLKTICYHNERDYLKWKYILLICSVRPAYLKLIYMAFSS